MLTSGALQVPQSDSFATLGELLGRHDRLGLEVDGVLEPRLRREAAGLLVAPLVDAGSVRTEGLSGQPAPVEVLEQLEGLERA